MTMTREIKVPSVAEALEVTGAVPLSNPKHEKFALGVVSGLAPADAYQQAGYKTKDRTRASRKGCELRKKPEVEARIEFLKGQVALATLSSKEMTVREFERIGFARLSDVVEWDRHGMVTVKASDELTDEVAAAVSEVQLQKGRSLRVKMHDRIAAVKELADNHGLKDHQARPNVNVVIVAPEKLPYDEWLQTYGHLAEPHGRRIEHPALAPPPARVESPDSVEPNLQAADMGNLRKQYQMALQRVRKLAGLLAQWTVRDAIKA